MNESLKQFGEVINYMRRSNGLSQDKLAKAAGLHRTYISDIERGQRNLSLESMVKIAVALDVKVAEIFRQARL